MPGAGGAGAMRVRVVLVLLLFSAAFFLNTVAAAHRKPFWHDEIFTILVARLQSIGTIWRAAADGLDFMPPLNAMLTHALGRVAGEGPVVTRIPPMIGVWLACLAVFAIVRRRSNLVLAACAPMLLLWTAGFRYAVDARGYGLMLGLFGVSAFAWSEATRGTRRTVHLPLLAVCLAAGVWAHYYAALNVASLALGQVVRDFRRKEVDWGVWCAFAAACVFMLPLVSLAGSALAHTGRSWTLVDPAGLFGTYAFILKPLATTSMLGGLALLAIVGRVARITTQAPIDAQRIPVHEVIAAAACLLIPAAGVLAGRAGVVAFAERYALSAVVGAVPSVLLVVWVVSRRSRLGAWLVCAFLAVNLAQSTRAGLASLASPYPDPVAERPALVQGLERGEQVCVTGGLMYLQYWYYAPERLKPRLHYLVDPAAARRLMATDSFDIGLSALRRWSTVSAPDYDRFISAHPRFLVYGAGSGWLLDRLGESGATVRQTGVELGFRIYDVALPAPTAAGR